MAFLDNIPISSVLSESTINFILNRAVKEMFTNINSYVKIGEYFLDYR